MSQNSFLERRKVLIDKETLALRVEQMGHQITKDYAGKSLTLICVMKGAVYFFTDLSREINLDTRMEYLRVTSYEGEESSGRVEFKSEIDEPVTGKDVLVIEDILDTGRSLEFVRNYLLEQKPNSLKLCVLLDKPERRVVHGISADYVGFTIPNLFVIGYGLDLNQQYRNLPEVNCIIKSYEEERKVEVSRKKLMAQLNN